jgi:hypothetical protein
MKFGLGHYQALKFDGLLQPQSGVQMYIDIHLQL